MGGSWDDRRGVWHVRAGLERCECARESLEGGLRSFEVLAVVLAGWRLQEVVGHVNGTC